MLTDRIEQLASVGPNTAVAGFVDCRGKSLPCKIYIVSLNQATITLLINFNKAASQYDRHFNTNQRKLVISQNHGMNVYARNSIRFRVEADEQLDFAIKAEFEPASAMSRHLDHYQNRAREMNHHLAYSTRPNLRCFMM